MNDVSVLSDPSLDDEIVGIVARAINPHAWDEDYQGYWPTRAPLDQDYARHQAKEAIKAYVAATDHSVR